MIKVYTTNVNNDHDALEIRGALSEFLGSSLVTFDLEDCDKILRVESEEFNTIEIINMLNMCGFECEELI